ncbi:LysR family substrate-binding domain-containing protein [Streptomyces sp. NPDC097619]|uniref:LysR family substrate-binding domain-containing protein n=1 Tax=Streptomyces sp. NPDC097619 TaxID=3157228 RepID=UPI00332A249D
MTGSDTSPSFRLAYVPGVTPTKWVRIWNERLPEHPLALVQVAAADASALLREGGAEAGFVRLPVDRDELSAIPLYTEVTVVVCPKDHLFAAAEELTLADLDEELVLHPRDDVFAWTAPPGRPALERPETTGDAIELVAAGIGVLLVPQSLARLHHRKDLTYRPVTDAPQSGVVLSWPQDGTTDLIEQMIGIVRGRTANSTRGAQEQGRRTEGDGSAAKRAAKAPAKTPGRTAAKPAARGGRAGTRGGGSRTGGAAPKKGKPRRRS